MEDTEESGPKKESAPLVAAWKDSSRQERAMVGIVFAFLVLTGLGHIVTWARHDVPLKPWAVGFVMLVMLGICIWHSWLVKGPRQTVAFFLIAWAISWFCEFIGDNYAAFFGHYKYTETLGPRVGHVPILIIVTWSVIIYSAYMLIDWLVNLGGERRARTWWGRTIWAALLAAGSATMVCAWDMMVDPFATSRIWVDVAHMKPWWWWEGGPYLRELSVWKGEGGVPIGNFVGWWLAPFAIVFVFYLFFQKPNLTSGKLVNITPLLVYAFIFLTVFGVVLEMNWFEDGMNQVAMIGFFTMMPVILVSAVKVAWDYSRKEPPEAPETRPAPPEGE